MKVIIPMAGRGERFSRKGYTTPKPLIRVGDDPMVVKAAKDLPKGEEYIFIALEDHLQQYHIDEEINQFIPNATFLPLNAVTEGQACTALLGLQNVDDSEEVVFGACDNGMIFDRAKFERVKAASDVIVFTFRNNVTVVEKPSQYGWVKVKDGNEVDYVSVKKAISDQPLNDHAIIGAFWFKEAGIFKAATNKMIAENRRINNEFYIDECINDAVQLGYKVNVFEVDKYVCWGTPDDYLTYQYWESFFNK